MSTARPEALDRLCFGPTRLETLRYLAVGAALCAGLALLPADFSAALAVACALCLPLLAWVALRMPRDEAGDLLPILGAAIVLRLGVASLIAVFAPEGFFSLDQRRYEWLGQALADSWAGAGALPEQIHAKPGYYVWNALIFAAVGPVPLAPAFSNAAIAGFGVVLVHRITADLAGRGAARLAAALAAFFPSLVLWSSLNLKDAAAIAAILLALRGAQNLRPGRVLLGGLQIALGLGVLSQLRDYLVAITLLGLAAGVLLPRLRSVPAAIGLALALVLAIALGATPRVGDLDSASERFQQLEEYRRNLAVGGSAYHADADVSSPAAALRFLPVGLFYFLLAPAPWQLWNARQWLTLPEMLLWYALLPQVGLGARWLWQRRRFAALPLASVALLVSVAYALVEANLGTAYRHRAQVLVLYLIVAAVGLARRRAAPAVAVAGEASA